VESKFKGRRGGAIPSSSYHRAKKKPVTLHGSPLQVARGGRKGRLINIREKRPLVKGGDSDFQRRGGGPFGSQKGLSRKKRGSRGASEEGRGVPYS